MALTDVVSWKVTNITNEDVLLRIPIVPRYPNGEVEIKRGKSVVLQLSISYVLSIQVSYRNLLKFERNSFVIGTRYIPAWADVDINPSIYVEPWDITNISDEDAVFYLPEYSYYDRTELKIRAGQAEEIYLASDYITAIEELYEGRLRFEKGTINTVNTSNKVNLEHRNVVNLTEEDIIFRLPENSYYPNKEIEFKPGQTEVVYLTHEFVEENRDSLNPPFEFLRSLDLLYPCKIENISSNNIKITIPDDLGYKKVNATDPDPLILSPSEERVYCIPNSVLYSIKRRYAEKVSIVKNTECLYPYQVSNLTNSAVTITPEPEYMKPNTKLTINAKSTELLYLTETYVSDIEPLFEDILLFVRRDVNEASGRTLNNSQIKLEHLLELRSAVEAIGKFLSIDKPWTTVLCGVKTLKDSPEALTTLMFEEDNHYRVACESLTELTYLIKKKDYVNRKVTYVEAPMSVDWCGTATVKQKNTDNYLSAEIDDEHRVNIKCEELESTLDGVTNLGIQTIDTENLLDYNIGTETCESVLSCDLLESKISDSSARMKKITRVATDVDSGLRLTYENNQLVIGCDFNIFNTDRTRVEGVSSVKSSSRLLDFNYHIGNVTLSCNQLQENICGINELCSSDPRIQIARDNLNKKHYISCPQLLYTDIAEKSYLIGNWYSVPVNLNDYFTSRTVQNYNKFLTASEANTFFSNHKIRRIISSKPVDNCFLDGLHNDNNSKITPTDSDEPLVITYYPWFSNINLRSRERSGLDYKPLTVMVEPNSFVSVFEEVGQQYKSIVFNESSFPLGNDLIRPNMSSIISLQMGSDYIEGSSNISHLIPYDYTSNLSHQFFKMIKASNLLVYLQENGIEISNENILHSNYLYKNIQYDTISNYSNDTFVIYYHYWNFDKNDESQSGIVYHGSALVIEPNKTYILSKVTPNGHKYLVINHTAQNLSNIPANLSSVSMICKVS